MTHPNVVRVVEAARRLGLEIDSRRFPDGTKTAADAAAAIGVDVGQIVKSLIFAVDGEVVLAYVSGANRARRVEARDGRRRAHVLARRRRRRAHGHRLSRSVGCRRSDTPPSCAVFVDPDLLRYDEVWAAAGTWHDVFAITPSASFARSAETVVDLKRAGATPRRVRPPRRAPRAVCSTRAWRT